jgi:hypothetical protein
VQHVKKTFQNSGTKTTSLSVAILLSFRIPYPSQQRAQEAHLKPNHFPVCECDESHADGLTVRSVLAGAQMHRDEVMAENSSEDEESLGFVQQTLVSSCLSLNVWSWLTIAVNSSDSFLPSHVKTSS